MDFETQRLIIADKLDTCNWTPADFACSRECIGYIVAAKRQFRDPALRNYVRSTEYLPGDLG